MPATLLAAFSTAFRPDREAAKPARAGKEQKFQVFGQIVQRRCFRTGSEYLQYLLCGNGRQIPGDVGETCDGFPFQNLFYSQSLMGTFIIISQLVAEHL